MNAHTSQKITSLCNPALIWLPLMRVKEAALRPQLAPAGGAFRGRAAAANFAHKQPEVYDVAREHEPAVAAPQACRHAQTACVEFALPDTIECGQDKLRN